MSGYMGMNGHIWMLKQILRNCPHWAKNCIIDRLISYSIIDRNRTCKSCPYFMKTGKEGPDWECPYLDLDYIGLR